MKNQKVKFFITGANGFVGSSLVSKLVELGHEVYCFDRSVNNQELVAKKFQGDLKDINSISRALIESQPDIVIHLASQKLRSVEFDDIYSSIEENLIGSLNLFKSCTSVDSIKSILVFGTAEEYGLNDEVFTPSMRELPISSYSYSKVCITQMAQLLYKTKGLPAIIIRPSIAYGPNQAKDMFIPELINSLNHNENFEMTSGEQSRQFIYIDDLINAVILIAKDVKPIGQIINITNDEKFTIKEVALKISAHMNKTSFLKIGAKQGRKLEIDNYELDCSYLKDSLGWNAKTNFTDGITKIINSLD